MKKGYKDWLDLDVDTIEPLELSDAKKVDIKNNILAKSRKKKNFMSLRQLTTAAFIGISTVTAMSITFPTVASQIPFIQNIVGYFNNEDTIYEHYGDFATEIDQIQTSNGVSIMIENAVFDGTSLSVSYAVESDIDLGPNPSLSNKADIKGASGLGAHGSLQKISDTTYVGMEKITPHFDKEAPDEISVSWQPISITDWNTNMEVKGDWQFEFKISKLDGELQLINQSVTSHGVTVVVNSFEKNDMSTVIHYEQFVEASVLKQWPYISTQIYTVQDDLGNTYIVDGNGGRSHDNGLSYKSSGTIQSIDPDAKSLTLTPNIHFSFGSGKVVETKEMEPIIIDLH